MQDKKKIEQKMRKEYPPLKTARELEWGFKIRYVVVSFNFMIEGMLYIQEPSQEALLSHLPICRSLAIAGCIALY